MCLDEHKLESEIMLKTLSLSRAKYRGHASGQIWDNLSTKILKYSNRL